MPEAKIKIKLQKKESSAILRKCSLVRRRGPQWTRNEKRHEAPEPKIYTYKYIDQNELLRVCQYITNSKISFTFWTVHMSVNPPAACAGLPTILFYGFRIPFTFMRRIESVRDKSVSRSGGGGTGGGLLYQTKGARRMNVECLRTRGIYVTRYTPCNITYNGNILTKITSVEMEYTRVILLLLFLAVLGLHE